MGDRLPLAFIVSNDIPCRIYTIWIPEIGEYLGKSVAEIRKAMRPVSLPENKYVLKVSGEKVGEDYVFRGGYACFEYDPNKK